MDGIINFMTEDVTGTLVQIFFAWTIISMILDKQKPPLITSIPTGIALITFGVGGSLTSTFVAVLSILNGMLWLYLAWQRYKQDNKKEQKYANTTN